MLDGRPGVAEFSRRGLAGAESPYRETAQSLLAAMQRVDAVRPPELSEREKEVLERLEHLQAVVKLPPVRRSGSVAGVTGACVCDGSGVKWPRVG